MVAGIATVVVMGAPLALQRMPHSTSAGTLPVTLLQGNIAQGEKFQPASGIPAALQWYGEQLRDAKTPLVVAPETAVPLLPQQLPDGYWDALQKPLRQRPPGRAAGRAAGRRHDGLHQFGAGPASPARPMPYRYDKHHLVPFGEFIPPLFKWFTEMMNIPLGDFNRGDGRPAVVRMAGPAPGAQRLLRGSVWRRTGRALHRPGHGAHGLGQCQQHRLVWRHRGDRPAPADSRMRALEFERPMLRATNTGATVIIDHRGRVTQSLPRLTRGALVAEVEGRNGLTRRSRGGCRGWGCGRCGGWGSRWWPWRRCCGAELGESRSS